jgi:hypothetical protein
MEAQVGCAWCEIVGAGFDDDLVGLHPAEVDEKILGWIIVRLDVGVWEGRLRIFRGTTDFVPELPVHAKQFAEGRGQTFGCGCSLPVLLVGQGQPVATLSTPGRFVFFAKFAGHASCGVPVRAWPASVGLLRKR